MVHKDRVVAILDWEYAGWYPEYWGYYKAMNTVLFKNDRARFVVEILYLYYCEYTVDSTIKSVIF
jgi:hypothetical protein